MNAPAASPGAAHTSRAMRRTTSLVALTMVVIGLVLLYMLMQATNNRDLYERNYAVLFYVNMAVAALLVLAIAWVAYRLVGRLRQGKFGSRLLVKLAAIFALVGIVPGLLIYVVSYQFVSRSIETWFDVKVEGALDAGLSLGRVTLETLTNDLNAKTRAAAAEWPEAAQSGREVGLERMAEQLGASSAALWTSSGQLLASTGQTRIQLIPDKPTPAQFRAARADRSHAWVEGFDDAAPKETAAARIRVLVPLASESLDLSPDTRYLLITRSLPSNLVANALAVESANREYQERALAREGLKRMYIGTLTLSLFLAVFGAILLAVVLGNQIVRPLLVLAEGVNQVAAGDLTPKLAMQGRDELGGLTRAFATMTAQLSGARQEVERSMAQVDAARAHLQTILDNLTAGVMVLSVDGAVRSFNPSAERILQVPLARYLGDAIDAVPGLKDFGAGVRRQFSEFAQRAHGQGSDHWQQSFELGASQAPMHSPFDRALTLVARGAELPEGERLLVFDDISEIVSAQRAQAWGEVARRLAHEIKNPLTPIQLSAERLEMKLAGKLAPPEQAVLNKSVKTIVDQVDAMKRLVNEFRDYARLPAAELKPVDLNALIHDVLHLYEAQPTSAAIGLDLDAQCPDVVGDAQQLRQVIHNLLQNAQDASESAAEAGRPRGAVTVRTQWQAASQRVRLSVLDHGTGFSDAILKRAFEPYVTTKTKGTGLGLAVVKKIADEHGSRVDIANRMQDGKVVGAQVSLSLPTHHTAA